MPLLALVGLVIVAPSVVALGYSFTDWYPGYESSWVGLRNYRHLLADPLFHQVLVNEAVLLLGIPIWLFLPLALATLLHRRVRGASVFRSIYFLPSVLSPAILGILFSQLLSAEGALNQILDGLGMSMLAGSWLSNPVLVKPTLIGVVAWAALGTGVVIFSAALATLPEELFEAAELDGAGWWHRLRYVVVPGLADTIRIWLVLLVITVFLGLFPWVYALTRGGPSSASTTIDFDIYQRAFSYGEFGLAAAESALMLGTVGVVFALAALVTGVARRWSRRTSHRNMESA